MAAFASSYIKTVASQVTRAADAASMTGTNFSSWYNQAEGTIYADYYQATPGSVSTAAFSISDGTANNRIAFFSDGLSTVSIQPGLFVTANGVAQSGAAAGVATQNTFCKFAGAYKADDLAQSLNGAAAVADTSVLIPVVDRAFIGGSQTGTTSIINSTIRKIAYYPIRCTNAQLQGLTS